MPAGEEDGIAVYYLRESEPDATWQRLATVKNADYNIASAVAQGPGLYTLMTSVAIPLEKGWNLIAYPVKESRPVAQALASIKGLYTVVYGHNRGVAGEKEPSERWRVHCDCDVVPPWLLPAAPLTELEFGQGYWISVKEPVTLYLKGNEQ
ncbi:hypothetical protein KFU94_31160 [Chloroflexi bacterium TSY]|nr:hypothetical protein [Chloroflexi bacterium TSY]